MEQKGLGKNRNGNGQPFFDIRVKLFGITAEHFQVLKEDDGLSNNREEIWCVIDDCYAKAHMKNNRKRKEQEV